MTINFNVSNNHVTLTGDLVFHNLAHAEKRFRNILSNHDLIKVDLAEINLVDTAGLALLITWKKLAKAKGTQMHFDNVPKSLQNVAELSGVEDFFNL